MKLILASLAAAGATLFAPPVLAASAATQAQCSPLTEANMEQCCAADNWKDVIRAEDVAYCPPLKDDTSGQSGRKGTKFGGAGAKGNNAGSGNAGTGGTGSNNNQNGSGN